MVISSWLSWVAKAPRAAGRALARRSIPAVPWAVLGNTRRFFTDISSVRHMFGHYRDLVLSAVITLVKDQPHSCFLDKLSLCGYVFQQYLVTVFRIRVLIPEGCESHACGFLVLETPLGLKCL